MGSEAPTRGRPAAKARRRERRSRAIAAAALFLTLSILSTRPALGQVIDAALPRAREFRAGITLGQTIYDQTYLPGGDRELLGAAYSQEMDARLFPELPDLTAAVTDLLSAVGGAPLTAPLTAGRATLDLQAEVTEITFDLLFGVTSWLSLGGQLPLVRARAFARPTLASGSAGAGPAATAFGGNSAGFLSALNAAIASLENRIASGTLDPAQQAQADALRDRARAYADGLESLRDGFGLLPTDSSAAGLSLHAVHDELAAGFSAFAITFPSLDLADPFPADTAFAPLADSLATAPFGDADTGYRLGDAAVTLLVQPVNTFKPRALGEPEPTFRVRLAAGVARRFATGSEDRPDRGYDLPTTGGSNSLEWRGTLDLAIRRRAWVTFDALRTVQERHTLVRRVAPPDTPLVDASRETNVERDPGNRWLWTVVPRLNLNEALSVGLIFQRERRDRDRYRFADTADAIPGISADVLGEGSDVRANRWGVELRYRGTGGLGEARPRWPVEAIATYLRTTSADGRAPAADRWQVAFRLYP